MEAFPEDVDRWKPPTKLLRQQRLPKPLQYQDYVCEEPFSVKKKGYFALFILASSSQGPQPRSRPQTPHRHLLESLGPTSSSGPYHSVSSISSGPYHNVSSSLGLQSQPQLRPHRHRPQEPLGSTSFFGPFRNVSSTSSGPFRNASSSLGPRSRQQPRSPHPQGLLESTSSFDPFRSVSSTSFDLFRSASSSLGPLIQLRSQVHRHRLQESLESISFFGPYQNASSTSSGPYRSASRNLGPQPRHQSRPRHLRLLETLESTSSFGLCRSVSSISSGPYHNVSSSLGLQSRPRSELRRHHLLGSLESTSSSGPYRSVSSISFGLYQNASSSLDPQSLQRHQAPRPLGLLGLLGLLEPTSSFDPYRSVSIQVDRDLANVCDITKSTNKVDIFDLEFSPRGSMDWRSWVPGRSIVVSLGETGVKLEGSVDRNKRTLKVNSWRSSWGTDSSTDIMWVHVIRNWVISHSDRKGHLGSVLDIFVGRGDVNNQEDWLTVLVTVGVVLHEGDRELITLLECSQVGKRFSVHQCSSNSSSSFDIVVACLGNWQCHASQSKHKRCGLGVILGGGNDRSGGLIDVRGSLSRGASSCAGGWRGGSTSGWSSLGGTSGSTSSWSGLSSAGSSTGGRSARSGWNWSSGSSLASGNWAVGGVHGLSTVSGRGDGAQHVQGLGLVGARSSWSGGGCWSGLGSSSGFRALWAVGGVVGGRGGHVSVRLDGASCGWSSGLGSSAGSRGGCCVCWSRAGLSSSALSWSGLGRSGLSWSSGSWSGGSWSGLSWRSGGTFGSGGSLDLAVSDLTNELISLNESGKDRSEDNLRELHNE
ncbi:hypothetical protein OGAPHI_006984 [Ogataea philodendri]|uniref:Uncharacterized protein n=1 Tax=Ogataea philodendri TaxID=1378263 RepID=A0A9P8NU45_9ASCO|nr:uncharacterized protein OGAPHI_006984 [Ogataea philodendri]KAH3660398.1 hypothetical protein OGAPHI_006984 [Ogataea philodendri]